jgi:5'-nucleotidase
VAAPGAAADTVAAVRVLVTNDDGVNAPGLAVLARALRAAGHDLVVAAPLVDFSGSGAAIGPVHLTNGVTFEEVEIEGLEGVPVYGLDGPPALAVVAARLGGFGPPIDLVVSGVNPGNNTGRAVLHSGTVGATLTAANVGVSGVAVSVGWNERPQFATGAAVAVAAVAWIRRAPARTVLNINTPDLPLDQVRGIRAATLATFGTVRTTFVGTGDGRLELEMQETTEVELAPDSDTALVRDGFVAVTSLVGVRATDDGGASDAMEELLTGG